MNGDWTGQKKHVCKRGFKAQRDAKEYERNFLDQQNTTSDILFSSLVENYLEDMSHRLKPTTMEQKRFIIDGKKMSAIMNYAVRHYRLAANPCHAAGSIGRSNADTMKIWNQEEYEQFSKCIKKSAMRLAFDVLFYTGMHSGELLALTESDILPTKKISVNKNYARVDGEELFLVPKTPKANRTIAIPDFLFYEIFLR